MTAMSGLSVLDASYEALLGVVATLNDDLGWQSTRCAGWTVRDLVHHLLSDAQRAVVALHTPASGPVDVDAVSYWKAWQPGTSDAEAGLRGTRIMASAWTSVAPIATAYLETAGAVLAAAREKDADALVITQGHVITVDGLCRTLAVEATVHQLDLRLGEPSEPGLEETRRVLDGLLGQVAPMADSTRYALVGTGREQLTDAEAHAFGPAAERLPLFG
ncbi:hypothetical protein I601_3840 [Nocardioides dokdonensis FR1436]|uniref:Mycothiol-dependent maleylpyruvate isomerase metal-binding domain-containing protein n=2 Tax=Nocardioides TaxID=1839 RepID=A0A1A9GPL7_9ACTN|nr:hypothetical protein I601_3840 [Nocardioides dokdonensis FR1436]